ncbi:MAG: trypsin-like peptidase domain-containing protein [Candidatus Moraniibacteriota bacterium]|nr:MAG: trypsin-like peptidase domain-containing protein [Candidatus Moranbacteria bacterium]
MSDEQPDFSVSGNPTRESAPRISLERSVSPVRVPRTPWLCILILSFVFGLIGGLVTRFDSVADLAALFRPKALTEKGSQSPSLASVPLEDQAIVSVVERGSPAVVSIVITKDVPKVRNFYRSPFGSPFFGTPSRPSTDDEDEESTKQTIGSGSGFLVSSDGYIVTNKHVVADTKAEYTVITSDKKEYPATVLALDPVNDIAVIKVNGDAFPALSLGDSDTIRVGQTAIAIGNPLGEFANSVSRGIISGLKRRVVAGSGVGRDEEVLRDIIQTDAAINPGNSGGPLLNLAGEVIGINVAVAQGAENIGFAIPVNQIKRAVDEVKRTGKIAVPYLGVRYILLDEEVAKAAGLSVEYGALIQRGQNITDLAIVPGSPADKAGLVENDIILEIDGQRVDVDHPLANLIGVHQVGDTVKLKILHKGEEQELSVRLEERKN